jgi:hypothetical protein
MFQILCQARVAHICDIPLSLIIEL